MSPVEQDRQQVLYARGPHMAVSSDPCRAGRSSLLLTLSTEHSIASVFDTCRWKVPRGCLPEPLQSRAEFFVLVHFD